MSAQPREHEPVLTDPAQTEGSGSALGISPAGPTTSLGLTPIGLAQMNSVSPTEPEGSEFALAGRELPETAVSESQTSQAVDESESNGQTDAAPAEDPSASPESQGSNARDSLGHG